MRALDAGAHGIIAPMIDTAAMPADWFRRVSTPRRAHAPSAQCAPDSLGVMTTQPLPIARYCQIAMIETRAAVDNLDEIAATPGLAGLYIGPADLSLVHGLAAEFDRQAPFMLELIERIRIACRSNGIAACIHCSDPAYARRMAGEGFDLVTIGSDARFIEAGAKTATAFFRQAN